MACASCVVSSKVAFGVKERLESLVDNVKTVREQINSKIQMIANMVYSMY